MAAEPIVLTINAGSSSLRLALFSGAEPDLLASRHDEDNATAVADVRAWARRHGVERPDVVAHRVVHGGVDLVAPCAITARVEAEIERLASLAPLHNPAALKLIRGIRSAWGDDLPQVAVFDTGFYADLPAVASRYALPDFAGGEPLRRYGFHGIAHEAMLAAWRESDCDATAGARTISLQLGAGCSITAAVDGRPVETSMGFTPLEGLVMATRSGDVDPGLLLHLLRGRGRTVADLERLLNHQSGLLGLSGTTGDMRVLLASSDPAARLAVDVYCHRVRKYIGAYLAVLGGADAILFGGGVGEHSALIRERSLTGLGFAGVRLDAARNSAAAGPASAIHAADSTAAIWVLAVNEAQFMARIALRLMRERGSETFPGRSRQ